MKKETKVRIHLTDKELHKSIELVDSHLDSHYDEIGQILDVDVSEELKENLLGLVSKMIQKLELNKELQLRRLSRSFTLRLKFMLWKRWTFQKWKERYERTKHYLKITNGE